jgi:hypothetical protein
MKKEFFIDDWIYYDFKLSQITDMEDGIITKISDGSFSTWSMDLNKYCFPIDMEIKQISDMVNSHYNEIYDLNFISLNYPEVHRKFVEYWVEMCSSIYDDPDYHIDIKSKYLSFFENLKFELNKLKKLTINNVKLFR